MVRSNSTRGSWRGSCRGNTCDDTDQLAERVNVGASGSTLDGLTLVDGAERAGVLDALVASEASPAASTRVYRAHS